MFLLKTLLSLLQVLPLSNMATPIDLFGNELETPQGIKAYGGSDPAGLINLLSNIFRIAIFASLIVAAINFLISGIEYIGSSGNPDTIKKASGRIWISLLGLVVATSALALAGIIGKIFFGNAGALTSPIIYGP